MTFPDSPSSIAAPREWFPVLEALDQEKGIAVLLGATDTGKSTFAKYLIDQLCRRKIKTALVDADIGQSSLGPPTTIGLSVFESPPKWDHLRTPELFFVGSNTPEENIPLQLEGVKRMVVRALSSGAEMILVDTTGLVQGDLGRELKRRKIDLLSPRLILALQREGELEHILESYPGHSMVRIFRLSPSVDVRMRSREERRSYRMKKFQEYFNGSELTALATDQILLEGQATGSDGLPLPPGEVLSIKGLLIGLKDAQENTLALGLIQSYQQDSGRVHVLTPLSGSAGVARLHLSSLRLLPTFEDERI